jgi:hypothetical protein
MSQEYNTANDCPQNEFFICKPTLSEVSKSPSVVAVCFPTSPFATLNLRGVIFRFLNASESRSNLALFCFFYDAHEINIQVSLFLYVSLASLRKFFQ